MKFTLLDAICAVLVIMVLAELNTRLGPASEFGYDPMSAPPLARESCAAESKEYVAWRGDKVFGPWTYSCVDAHVGEILKWQRPGLGAETPRSDQKAARRAGAQAPADLAASTRERGRRRRNSGALGAPAMD